ncbi:MAG: helix-turn-helix transcriptional regulator [Clostridia bacterium]|nr:helix-turn-helix transcriptional regulator [Clostridia bacterium]
MKIEEEIVISNIGNIPITVCSPCVFRVDYPYYHLHKEIELLYVERGMLKCELTDCSFDLHSGDIAFIGSRVIHITLLDEQEDCVRGYIQFCPGDYVANKDISRFLRRFFASEGKNYGIFRNGSRECEYLKREIINILDEYKKRELSYDIYIRGSVLNILGFLYRYGYLAETHESVDFKAIQKIDKALSFIEENYASDITLDEISKISGVSKNYFCRMFKEATKSNFIEYLNFIRVCHAEKLLRDTENRIVDIAYEVGFSSNTYFNRAFHKINGCSPLKYRKYARNRMDE